MRRDATDQHVAPIVLRPTAQHAGAAAGAAAAEAANTSAGTRQARNGPDLPHAGDAAVAGAADAANTDGAAAQAIDEVRKETALGCMCCAVILVCVSGGVCLVLNVRCMCFVLVSNSTNEQECLHSRCGRL